MHKAARQRSQFVRDLEESQSRRGYAARPSRSAESSIDGMWGIEASVASLRCQERQSFVGEPGADLFAKAGISRWESASTRLDARLFAREFALAGNSLVRFRGPLDPVLKFATPLGQLLRYHVASAACAPIREVWSECDLLAGLKFMLCHRGVFLAYMCGHGYLLRGRASAAGDQQSRLRSGFADPGRAFRFMAPEARRSVCILGEAAQTCRRISNTYDRGTLPLPLFRREHNLPSATDAHSPHHAQLTPRRKEWRLDSPACGEMTVPIVPFKSVASLS